MSFFFFSACFDKLGKQRYVSITTLTKRQTLGLISCDGLNFFFRTLKDLAVPTDRLHHPNYPFKSKHLLNPHIMFISSCGGQVKMERLDFIDE